MSKTIKLFLCAFFGAAFLIAFIHSVITLTTFNADGGLSKDAQSQAAIGFGFHIGIQLVLGVYLLRMALKFYKERSKK